MSLIMEFFVLEIIVLFYFLFDNLVTRASIRRMSTESNASNENLLQTPKKASRSTKLKPINEKETEKGNIFFYSSPTLAIQIFFTITFIFCSFFF